MAAVEVLQTRGLSAPAAVANANDGRFKLSTSMSTVNPSMSSVEAKEKKFLKRTEISKMKGQNLTCAHNAKLIAVNLRYITYAMKEGQIRIIYQNGKNLYKVANSTKSPVIDMVLNGTGEANKPSTLICADAGGHVAVFDLQAKSCVQGVEESMKRVELEFGVEDPPRRVLGHPLDSRVFLTMHRSYVYVWSIAKIEDPPKSVKRPVDEELIKKAGSKVDIRTSELRDATLSVDGTCLIVLSDRAVHVWRLNTDSIGTHDALVSLQELSLEETAVEPMPEGGLHSVRTLSNDSGRTSGFPLDEVLILASSSGCHLLACDLLPANPSPVGPVVQSIKISSSEGADLSGILEVNAIAQDTLALGVAKKAMIFVMPLRATWMCGGASGLPFPYLQQLVPDEAAHQLSITTGKSSITSDRTLFMYAANNFTRPQDNLLGCDVMVYEVTEVAKIARVPADPACVAPDIGMIQVVVSGEAVHVHSAILTLSSPVFKHMLSSGMKEAIEKKIDLPGKNKDEFEAFLSFLLPVSSRTAKITQENVDFLLEWFDTYNIAAMKDECEKFLIGMPPNVDRLVQSKRFALTKQYNRCVEALARDFEKHDMESIIKTDPDMFLDLIPAMRKAKKEAQDKMISKMKAIPEKICSELPGDEGHCGNPGRRQRIDHYARDRVAALISEASG